MIQGLRGIEGVERDPLPIVTTMTMPKYTLAMI